MAEEKTYYSWRTKDENSPWRNKKNPWRTLAWKMTEEAALEWARKEGFEIQPSALIGIDPLPAHGIDPVS